MQKLTLALVLFASLSISSIALAQRPGGEGGQRGMRGAPPRGMRGGESRPISPLMVALDTNKDGKLSAEEIDNATKALKSLDKNEDGIVDASEMIPSRPERGGRGDRGGRGGRGAMGDPSERINRMMELDTDKDGKVSKEEGGERMSRFFGYMDGDSDGFLTREEIEQSMKRWQGGGSGGRGGRSQPKAKDNRPAFDDDDDDNK